MIPTLGIVRIDLNLIIKRKVIFPIEANPSDSRPAIWTNLTSFLEFLLDTRPISSIKNKIRFTG